MKLLLLLLAPLLGAAVQSVLPTAWWCGGLRLELLPGLVVFGGLTLTRPRWAVVFGVGVGLAQDAFSAAPLGTSALAYGAVAGCLSAWHELLERDLPWIQLGAGAVASASASLVALFASGFVAWGDLVKLVLLALVSAVVTPFIFLLGDWLRETAEARAC